METTLSSHWTILVYLSIFYHIGTYSEFYIAASSPMAFIWSYFKGSPPKKKKKNQHHKLRKNADISAILKYHQGKYKLLKGKNVSRVTEVQSGLALLSCLNLRFLLYYKHLQILFLVSALSIKQFSQPLNSKHVSSPTEMQANFFLNANYL